MTLVLARDFFLEKQHCNEISKKNENDINFFLYINNVSNECVSSPVDNCVTIINGSNVKSVSELSRIAFEGSEDQPMMENGNNNSDNVHDVEQINLENHYAGSVDRSFVDDNSNKDNDDEYVSDDDKVHGVEQINLGNHYAGSVDRLFVDDNDVECVSDDDKVHGVERIRRNKKRPVWHNDYFFSGLALNACSITDDIQQNIDMLKSRDEWPL